MWEKLVTKLNDGKKHLIDMIEQATLAYDQREELCNKLQLLKDKGQLDKITHIQEMRELQRKLDHDAKLQEFLEVKGQRRSNTELEEREAMRKKRMQEELQNQHEEYQATMQRIMKFSNEKDIEKLVQKFIKQEEENFALFNYVNELSHEVEALTDTVQQLENQIEEQRLINESKKNKEDESIEALTRELVRQQKMAEEAHELQLSCEVKLQKLLSGVERIYKYVDKFYNIFHYFINYFLSYSKLICYLILSLLFLSSSLSLLFLSSLSLNFFPFFSPSLFKNCVLLIHSFYFLFPFLSLPFFFVFETLALPLSCFLVVFQYLSRSLLP